MHFLLEKVNFHCHVRLQEGRWKDDHDFFYVIFWAPDQNMGQQGTVATSANCGSSSLQKSQKWKIPPMSPQKQKGEFQKKKKNGWQPKCWKTSMSLPMFQLLKDRWVHPFSWMATWHLTTSSPTPNPPSWFRLRNSWRSLDKAFARTWIFVDFPMKLLPTTSGSFEVMGGRLKRGRKPGELTTVGGEIIINDQQQRP